MKTTYLIADPDQAGQCRVVAMDNFDFVMSALNHYRVDPRPWREVGLMDAKGFLIAMTAPKDVVETFTDYQPLAAGVTFTFDLSEADIENVKLRDLLARIEADAFELPEEQYAVSATLIEEARKFLNPET